ncbi:MULTISPECIES: GNAT family N-acetyltransferase [unclassified Microbacterium]|uniref:GNAT family N-acetyltransferase n=1 Tax=unclassified Microbacterium TaxID=2609290 RepID=UPI000AA8D23A|nr:MULTISPECIES: GNAT family N-acetyltransferase [unclassified Microbacterium]MBN9215588.1 GNAT family N-acetyltransferase [Microbacterium sp.]
MPFTIRAPRPSDASQIAELHVATWKEAYAHLLPEDYFSPEYVARRHRMWAHVLTHPRDDMTVRVAEIDGAIVGFAWVGPSEAVQSQAGQAEAAPGEEALGEAPPRERTLYAIYVLAAHYGAGIGQALLDGALGSGPAMLWVAKQNPRAIAFYLRNRFRFDGVEQIDPHAPLITDARMVR